MNPAEGSPGRTITTLSSREVYRNPWMRVREDEILRSNGERGIFGVAEKDDAAIILPMDHGRVWLVEQFRYKNPMQVPVIDKIVINMGIGEAVADRKKVESAAADLALISGQRPVITKSRKAISTYKLRENQPIGCKVTLRKARMFEFIDRLINIALPRVRDFRGLNPKSFDGRGNYSLGLKEHIVFPEIDYDKTAEIWGMDITVCTTARTDDEARALLTAFNFPFRQ